LQFLKRELEGKSVLKEKGSVIDPRAKTSRYRYLMVGCHCTAGWWILFL